MMNSHAALPALNFAVVSEDRDMRSTIQAFSSIMLLSMLLTACAFFQSDAGLKLTADYAVAKYAEQIPAAERSARLDNIIRVTDDISAALTGTGDVSLPFLRQEAEEEIARLDLSEADKVLARGLLAVVAEEIQRRIGDGTLSPEQRVRVAEIVRFIGDSAARLKGA